MAEDSSRDRRGWGLLEQYPTPSSSQGFSGYGSTEFGHPAPGTWIPQPQDNQNAPPPQPAMYWNNLNRIPGPQQTQETPAIEPGTSMYGYQPGASSYSPGYQVPPHLHYQNGYQSETYPQILTTQLQSSFPPSEPPRSHNPPNYNTNTHPYEQVANAPLNGGSAPFPNPVPSYQQERPYVNQPLQESTRSLNSSQNVSGFGRNQGFPPQPLNYPYQNNAELSYFPTYQGRRRALLIGINYFGQEGNFKELRGAINDAKRVRDFLIQNYHYAFHDIFVLTDDTLNPAQRPTKANIEYEMRRLVSSSEPGDSLFFHFSGHGSQILAKENDEEDGMDEIILPVDWESSGHIDDNLMHTIMVKGICPGVRLTAVFDSCHSGTALDLPYIYRPDGKVKAPTHDWKDWRHEAVKASRDFSLKAIFSVRDNVERTRSSYRQSLETKTTDATVIMLSGAKDSQNARDTIQDGQHIGAMSWAFITALTKQPRQSYLELLKNVRIELRSKHYAQTPQLSCSHDLDISAEFVI